MHYPLLTDLEIRSLLGSVGIKGENVFKETGVISGGERAKVCFAFMMLEKGMYLFWTTYKPSGSDFKRVDRKSS